jgi:hypothetical protein
MYQEQVSNFWTATEISMSDDLKDWKKLNDDEKFFIKNVLAFFAGSDELVNMNLSDNLIPKIGIKEAVSFYRFQMAMEDIHSHAYALQLDTLFSDEEEKNRFDEPEPIKITIVARAICFPMLVHEIVKGLYELLSLQGFGTDKEQNQNVVRNVDQLSNEPHDMQYGKFIYDAVSNLYNESNYDDPRVRELLFVEIYKMQDEEFLIFIENAINNKLTPNQKRWAQNIMNDINNDLKKDDTGLEDLDELQINQPQKYS